RKPLALRQRRMPRGEVAFRQIAMRRGAIRGTGRERRAEPARRLLGIAVIQCLPAEDRRRVGIERIELGDAGPRLCRTARLPGAIEKQGRVAGGIDIGAFALEDTFERLDRTRTITLLDRQLRDPRARPVFASGCGYALDGVGPGGGPAFP